MTPKVQAIKAIIDKWDFIKLRVSAHQREQATDQGGDPKDREKVFIYHLFANSLTGKNVYQVLSSKKQNNMF